jgi:hypothetical protein
MASNRKMHLVECMNNIQLFPLSVNTNAEVGISYYHESGTRVKKLFNVIDSVIIEPESIFCCIELTGVNSICILLSKIHTYIPLMFYRRTGNRGISNIPPKRFTKLLIYEEHCNVTSGKPITICSQSFLGVSAN